MKLARREGWARVWPTPLTASLSPGLRWLLPRRVARRRLSPPPTRWWPENTPPAFTGAPMERLSRSVPLGYSKKCWNLSRRRWELQICALTPGSTKLLGQRNKESPILCALSENIMKTHHTSSVCWLPTYLSPSSKIYRWLLWMKTNQ